MIPKQFKNFCLNNKTKGSIRWTEFSDDDVQEHLILTIDGKEIIIGWNDCLKNSQTNTMAIEDALKPLKIFHYSRKMDKRDRSGYGLKYSIFSKTPLNSKLRKIVLDFLEETI